MKTCAWILGASHVPSGRPGACGGQGALLLVPLAAAVLLRRRRRR